MGNYGLRLVDIEKATSVTAAHVLNNISNTISTGWIGSIRHSML